MKLDLDLIKKILLFMEKQDDYEIARASKEFLCDTELTGSDIEVIKVGNDQYALQTPNIKKLLNHLRYLLDDKLIKSSNAQHPTGFLPKNSVGYITENHNNYEILMPMGADLNITQNGDKALDASKNDKLWSKIKDKVTTLGIGGLKQIPALAIALLTGK